MSNLVTQDAPKGIAVSGVVAGAKVQSLIPTDFEGAWRIAQVISHSPFCPKELNSIEACCSAIMLGLDVGLTPIQAVQSIAVINGRPSIWGDAALALCLSNPLCEDVTEEFSGDLADETTWMWTCTAKRKGRQKPTISTFTYADAQKAGLLGKSGPWQQYRRRMIQLRARAFGLRDTFPDILKGLAIREEMDDVDHGSTKQPVGTPRPPSAQAPVIEDAQVRDVTKDGAAADPAAAEQKSAETPAEEKKPTKPRATRPKADDTKAPETDQPKEDPIDTLKGMVKAATTIVQLDAIVAKDSKGKPSRGMEIYDTLSKNDQELMKAAYRQRKEEILGADKKPPVNDTQQQDDGAGEETSANELIAEFTKFCDSATDLDALDACMNHFEDRINELAQADRTKVEDIFKAAEQRIKGETVDDEEQDEGEQSEAAKDPADMTGAEYITYAEGYIGAATEFKPMKDAWFGEADLRTKMVEDKRMTDAQREALRVIYKKREAELRG